MGTIMKITRELMVTEHSVFREQERCWGHAGLRAVRKFEPHGPTPRRLDCSLSLETASSAEDEALRAALNLGRRVTITIEIEET